MTKKAVALLSGGMDSIVAAAMVAQDGYEIYALTVSYGQRHAREIEYSKLLAKWLEVRKHEIIELPIAKLLKSALTDPVADVASDAEMIGRKIPSTYVPARNTMLLSIALAWAESLGADAIIIGANSIDYSGYPDCRPEFIEAFQNLMGTATRRGVEGRPIRVLAPLITLSKGDIVHNGMELNVPFEYTWSCYRGGSNPCGECESCLLRKKGFESVGIRDPAEKE